MKKISYNKFKADKLYNLSKYARDSLKIEKAGIYKHGGKEYEKGYILPRDREELSLIKPFNTKLTLSELKESYSFHNCYYHLNSSQMMAFNYFLPYKNNNFLEADFDNLSEILSRLIGHKISIKNFQLEKESDLESIYLKDDEARKLGGNTTFDIFLTCKDNIDISVEIKYTEYGFGKSGISNDRHKKKFSLCYERCIIENDIGNYIDERYLTEDFFLKNYQLMRNLIHLYKENQIIIFLYPKQNIKVDNEAKMIKDIIVNSEALDRVKIIYWENLMEETIKIHENKLLLDYYLEFKDKYGI